MIRKLRHSGSPVPAPEESGVSRRARGRSRIFPCQVSWPSSWNSPSGGITTRSCCLVEFEPAGLCLYGASAADSLATNDRLLELIVTMFHRGEYNRIRLANKAITKFEAARG